MAEIGYNSIGANHHGRLDYYIQLNWIDQVTIGSQGGTLGDGKLYTRLYSGPGSVEYRMYVYEIGATDALSPLVASSSIVQSTSEGYQWLTIPFPGSVALEAGKTYAVAFSQNSVSGGAVPYFRFDGGTDTHRILDNGSFTAPNDLILFDAPGSATRYSAYVEYTDGLPPPDPTTIILARVEPPVRETSGRSTSSETGHEVESLLDSNLNTYWKPDSLTDRSLWFDLGVATVVDYVVFWLHNYNETYGGLKSWKLSYSSDDISYTALSEKIFEDERTVGVPLVVDELASEVTARYWKLELLNFDDHPPGPEPEVSVVWFMNKHELRYRSQLPDVDSLIYRSNIQESLSGNIHAEASWKGRNDALPRTFLLTSSSQYGELLSAYEASMGRCRPIALKPYTEDDEWRLCFFDAPLSRSEKEHELHRPLVTLKEAGFKRIPFTKKILPPLTTTVAWWRFNEDLVDGSGNGNDLIVYPGHPLVEPAYIPGPAEPGKTALNFPDGTETYGVYIPAASAGDLDMGMSNFTIEVIFLQEDTDLSTLLSKKGTTGPAWRVLSSDIGIRFEIEDDASHSATIDTDVGAGAGEWRYYAIVVNRSADTVNIYLDGVRVVTNYDISSVTGNITNASRNFHVQTIKDDLAVDEVCISKGYLGGDIIAERAAGFAYYGTWGM